MNIRRHMTKTRRGHWVLTLVDTASGFRATSAKHSTRHGALTEEDALTSALAERELGCQWCQCHGWVMKA